MKIGFFSKIIDNFGDAGFTIRLATSMTEITKSENITIYTDYKDLFYKLIPETKIKIKNIDEYEDKNDFIFFMFQHIPSQKIINKINKSTKKAFIIDYFTPETWADEANDTNSFVNGLNIPVEFIVPGLTKKSAGILNYPLYEKTNKVKNNIYLYTPEKIMNYIENGIIWGYKKDTTIKRMPFLPQKIFDSYIYGAKYNWIRGEDSLQLALNSGKPFFWEAYKQKDKIHHLKVKAYLDFIDKFMNNNDNMKNHYHRIIQYLNDIEVIEKQDFIKSYMYFEKEYNKLLSTFQNIKNHFQNKTNLQNFLIKKVTFL